MTAFISGFALGFSLILAIGAQNAFVLRQGIRREHVTAVVVVCILSDIFFHIRKLLLRTGHKGKREPLPPNDPLQKSDPLKRRNRRVGSLKPTGEFGPVKKPGCIPSSHPLLLSSSFCPAKKMRNGENWLSTFEMYDQLDFPE